MELNKCMRDIFILGCLVKHENFYQIITFYSSVTSLSTYQQGKNALPDSADMLINYSSKVEDSARTIHHVLLIYMWGVFCVVDFFLGGEGLGALLFLYK